MTARMGVVERANDGVAWVRVNPEHGCGRCHEPGGCRSDLIGEALGPRTDRYAVRVAGEVSPGTSVQLDVSDRAPMLAALLAYGLPLGGLLAGACTASLAGGGDLATAAAGLGGLALALPLARALAGRHAVRRHLMIQACPSVPSPCEHGHG